MSTTSLVRRARRFLLRRVPSILLIVAIAAYATMLYRAHVAKARANLQTRYVQRLASSADFHKNGIANSREGVLVMEPHPIGTARAQWRLASVARKLEPGSIVLSEDAFITGLDVSLSQLNSFAVISVNGRQIGRFKPLDVGASDDGPYTVAEAPIDAIDIPPEYTTGFRFPLGLSRACVRSACTLRIVVRDTTWIVRRVGIIFSVQPPPAPALWGGRSAPWIAICAAGVLALFSHILLSGRFRPPSTTPPELAAR